MTNDLPAKMALKTTSALREYVTGHYQYREEAVLAAFDELRARGLPAPEEDELRPGLEAAAAVRRTEEAAARAASGPVGAPEAGAEAPPSGPALYSPITILLFSIMPMSTMVTGGVLMAMNLYRLGKRKAIFGLLLFVVCYLFAISSVVNWAVFQGGLNPLLGMLLFNAPAALIYVRWYWPRYVGAVTYRNRSVLVPTLVCLLIVWSLQYFTPYIIKRQPPEVRQQLERYMKR